MKSGVTIDITSQIPVYKQIIQSIQQLIDSGHFSEGDFIPSMNELANELEVSKETVKKAYSILREKGVIDSSHGKGFFVTRIGNGKTRVLLLFDKISNYKQVIYSSFLRTIGDDAEITIRLHNQDLGVFTGFIEESLDNYDYYIVTPHFPLDVKTQKQAIKVLNRIPNRKLILLDRYIDGLQGNFGAVYQDFEQDVYDGLEQGTVNLRKYKKLNVISMKGSLYAPLIEKGIRAYCTEKDIKFEIYKNIDTGTLDSQEAFLILNSQLDSELIELVRAAKTKGCVIGKDIGIISYNESPINEIILDGLTVLSTDFEQMGELAARMITGKSMRKVRCNFRMIKRKTF